jgi:hypothetical protein
MIPLGHPVRYDVTKCLYDYSRLTSASGQCVTVVTCRLSVRTEPQITDSVKAICSLALIRLVLLRFFLGAE